MHFARHQHSPASKAKQDTESTTYIHPMAPLAMAKTPLLLLGVLLTLATASTPAAATILTIHNLCPYPVWPLITPDCGSSPISDNKLKLDGHGRGLVSYDFPPHRPWSGRLMLRTHCSPADPSRCRTGSTPPATVVQLSVHGRGGLAEYSVSLAEGFNVPAVVSPHAIGGGQCPALGCTADLNAGCPPGKGVWGPGHRVVACRGPPGYFKHRCPLTRTTATDVEPLPQHCLAPGELKVVLCQAAM